MKKSCRSKGHPLRNLLKRCPIPKITQWFLVELFYFLSFMRAAAAVRKI